MKCTPRTNSTSGLFKYLCILCEIVDYLLSFVIICQTSPAVLTLWASAVVVYSSVEVWLTYHSPNGNLLLTPRVAGDGCRMWGSACVGDGSIYWLINCDTFSLINANELLSHESLMGHFSFSGFFFFCSLVTSRLWSGLLRWLFSLVELIILHFVPHNHAVKLTNCSLLVLFV